MLGAIEAGISSIYHYLQEFVNNYVVLPKPFN